MPGLRRPPAHPRGKRPGHPRTRMVLEFHPYLNGVLEPHEIFPSDKKYAWKCLVAGHSTWQTVQHRRQSRGCTECERKERILVKAPLP